MMSDESLRRRRFSGLIATVAALALVPMVATSSPPAADGSARFDYAMGSESHGTVQGTCEGKGALLPAYQPVRFTLSSQGGVLRKFETWENYTVVLGYFVRNTPDSQSETVRAVPPGPLTISWDRAGRGTLFRHEAFFDGHEPFQVEFNASGLRTDRLTSFLQTGEYWVRTPYGISRDSGGIVGWARLVDLQDATLRVSGNVTVYLEGAQIEGPDGWRESVPPHYERVAALPTAEAGRYTVRWHHAFLDLGGVEFHPEPGLVRPACGGLAATVEGGFAAYDARGEVRTPQEAVAFDRRQLSLEGRFAYREAPEGLDPGNHSTARMVVEGEGSFRAVGLDFARVLEDSGLPGGATGLVVAGTVAAAGFALWKLVAFLFTRLRQERLLEQPSRRGVYQAIQASPGVTYVELGRRLGLGGSTLRYQVGVLERNQMVRSFRVRGILRLTPASERLEPLQRSAVLDADPKLAVLAARVGPAGAPANLLVRQLRSEWGLSRSGTWKVVDRAVAAQLLVKEKRGRDVILRIAS